jgi:hypothetical protein
MVLGCEPVVDVRSVMSSPSLTLEREAVCRGPACDVRRVPLSTLRLPDSASLCTASEVRRVLLTLAFFLRSAAAVVAVSGGLGGARVGAGGGREEGAGPAVFFSLSPSRTVSASRSVGSGVRGDFLRSASSRE